MAARLSCSCHCTICYFHKTLERQRFAGHRRWNCHLEWKLSFPTRTQNDGETAHPSTLCVSQDILGLVWSCISALSQEEKISGQAPVDTCFSPMLLRTVLEKQEKALSLWKEIRISSRISKNIIPGVISIRGIGLLNIEIIQQQILEG